MRGAAVWMERANWNEERASGSVMWPSSWSSFRKASYRSFSVDLSSK